MARPKRGEETTWAKLASPIHSASRPIDLFVKEIQTAVMNGHTTRTNITINTGASRSQPSATSRCWRVPRGVDGRCRLPAGTVTCDEPVAIGQPCSYFL